MHRVLILALLAAATACTSARGRTSRLGERDDVQARTPTQGQVVAPRSVEEAVNEFLASTTAPRVSLLGTAYGLAAAEQEHHPANENEHFEDPGSKEPGQRRHGEDTRHPPGHAGGKAALARAAQNPIASMVSVQFQNNMNFSVGPDDNMQNIMLFQPVIPISFSENWNLIVRPITPLISQPKLAPGVSAESGIGNIVIQTFFTPKHVKGKWIWGLGPNVQLPSSTDDRLGKGAWGGGPSFVVLTMPGHWVIGTLFVQTWSFQSGPTQSNFTWQTFINYNMNNGWYLTSGPVVTANWQAKGSDQWTVPIGAGIGKIGHIGNQAVNVQIQGFGNVVRPSGGAEFTLRLQFTFLFPKKPKAAKAK